jgi:leucyl-tRNA synthetase
MTLRVSAKDLIPNHLTMALFNHAAIWEEEPELWPRGYYTNGHVLVDAEKMSKSKGNFLMMNETVENYSADATRFACADAGDSLDDANFSRETADSAIVSLSNEEAWILETMSSCDLRTEGDLNFMDRVLLNETNRLITQCGDAFAKMQFREGLQHGWFEMLLARGEYRSWCQDSSIPLHKDVVTKWIEALVILICPICPHWSEKLWKDLGKEGLAVKAPWPAADEEDKLLTRQAKFLRDALKKFRGLAGKAKKGWTSASLLVTNTYPEWKLDVLKFMQETYSEESGDFPATFMKDMKKWSGDNVTDKKMIKETMQFASFMKDEAMEVGSVALDLELPFDQYAILEGSLTYIKTQLNIPDLDILDLKTVEDIPLRVAEQVSPGRPHLWMR